MDAVNFNKKMSNMVYLIVTIGISTTLTYVMTKYAISSLAYPTLNLYFKVEKIRIIFSVLAPTMSALGALLTMRYKSWGQVLLSVLFPCQLLLTAIAAQYYSFATMVIVFIAVAFTVCSVVLKIRRSKIREKNHLISLLIRFGREQLVIVLMLSMVLGAYSSIKAETNLSEWILQSETVSVDGSDMASCEKNELNLVTPDEFDNMNLQERTQEAQKLVQYLCIEKGIKEIKISVEKLEDDNILAYFNDEINEITISAVYLATCEMDTENGMVYTLCHEMEHAEQFALISAVEILEAADVEVENLNYFDYAVKLKYASDGYARDSNAGYESYCENFLESEADRYGEEKLFEISEKLGW